MDRKIVDEFGLAALEEVNGCRVKKRRFWLGKKDGDRVPAFEKVRDRVDREAWPALEMRPFVLPGEVVSESHEKSARKRRHDSASFRGFSSVHGEDGERKGDLGLRKWLRKSFMKTQKIRNAL